MCKEALKIRNKSFLLKKQEDKRATLLSKERDFRSLQPTEICDKGDLAVISREKELLCCLIEVTAKTEKEVSEIIDKFHYGTYGICENCFEDIEDSILKKNPLAKICEICHYEMCLLTKR
ncbi:MAG: hypothetical protein Athens071412_502 [Parcubacteria group bacterium Athens0714_12]|nr:MAG: hypothetical protein Athens071412_502 [Parcubacteria group bacterium Athens0714_12]